MGKTLSTVHNALMLLETFTLDDPEWGVRQLAQRRGLAAATTSRLVNALCSEGFLVRTAERRYRLHPALRDIAVFAARSTPLYPLAMPELVRIRHVLDIETTLTVLHRGEALIVERLAHIESENAGWRRRRWPAYATSGGKALLAFSPPGAVDDAFRAHSERCTPHTLNRRAALAKELETIRRNRYALDAEESRPGWRGLAAPVFDGAGAPIAAISIESPRAHWRPAASAGTVRALLEAADTIGAAFR